MVREDLTLGKLFAPALGRFGSRVAIVQRDRQVTYAQLLSLAYRAAHAMQRHGVGPNVTVGLLMSNCIEYVVSDLAIMFAGGTRIGLNDMLAATDIQYILADAKVRLLITDAQFVDVIEAIRPTLPELETVVVINSNNIDGHAPSMGWEDFIGPHSDQAISSTVHSSDRALIIYTGGTTGRPKGVVHRQDAMVLNFLSHVIELEMQDDETLLLTTPLPHSAGFLLNAGLLKGALHIIEQKFDPARVLTHLKDYPVTMLFMVPTMLYRMLDVMEQQPSPPYFPKLRTILYGAAPITVARLEQGLKRFGPVFVQLYGQSEAPNWITRLRKEDHRLDKPGLLASCGQSVMMSEVQIVDDDGDVVPFGQVGELIARTPYNMVEYHALPDKTHEALRDGWLYTGDMAWMDKEGYCYLVDRKKDLIISGGMNVYSSEVENVIQRYPGVLQVAVIGVPHPDWGEAVMAIVVPDPDRALSVEELLQWCRQELAKYKRPKDIVFVDALPVTAYGKVDKKALRQRYWQGEARQIH